MAENELPVDCVCRACGAPLAGDARYCSRCGAPAGGTSVAPVAESSGYGFAVVSMVTGILATVGTVPLIGHILAVVFAMLARREMKRTGNYDGKGMATAGLVLGVIGLVFFGLLLTGAMVFFALMALRHGACIG